MLDFNWNDQELVELIDSIRHIRNFRPDLKPMVKPVEDLVRKRMEEDREAGRGRDGNQLRPVTQATRERRERKGQDPSAEPFVPRHGGSRSRTQLQVEVTPMGSPENPKLNIQTGYSTTIFRVHALGIGSQGNALPVRDIYGPTPATLDEITDWAADETMRQAMEVVRGRFQSGFGSVPPTLV
jgi:hypothetical protein